MPSERDVRSIAVTPPIAPRRLHGGRPVLQPVVDHPWESRVVLNPAATHVPAGTLLDFLMEKWNLDVEKRDALRSSGGACIMLYRAQGATVAEKGAAPSSLGLAILTPELDLVARFDDPVLAPDAPFHDLGVEDPRCTRVDDTFYLYYTGYARDEGGGGRVRICLATTQDFREWTLHGPIEGALNSVPNKNAALLPLPVHGRWRLLHRPMEGAGAMAIHTAEAPTPAGPWTDRGLLMESYRYEEFARSWIGAGGPPLHLDGQRFLMIYHQGHYTADGAREYDLAAALLDFGQPDPVRARIEPLMRPIGTAEQEGDAELGVDNVLFTCANYAVGDRLVIPYAGADSRIFGAEISVRALTAALENRL